MRFLILFLLSISSSLHALECDSAITTLDFNRCAKLEQDRVESELNAVYKQLINRLSNNADANLNQLEVKERLVMAQRAWIKFRIKDCQAAYAMYQGASIRNIKYISCMQERAEQRIKELNRYLVTEN